jgi:2-polyprenyl-3-methyl-5-hydroxy-6-metoxy-1,4-benzoquinol methylase
MLNQAHTSTSGHYYTRERPSITGLIEPGPHAILDLGCGSGAVGRKLKETGKASELVGVEIFKSAADEASRHYAKVYCGDIEAMTLPYEKRFDYVLCGDILEHLKDPYEVVGRIHGWLKDDGHFICSVPNVRNWRVLAGLIFRGAWEYRDAGIMDRTHLRFFTRRSCWKMVRDGGFEVERSRLLIWGRRYQWLNVATFGLLDEFLGSQIVVMARKRSPGS